MQREFIAWLLIFLGSGACSLLRIIRQAGQFRFVFYIECVLIGSVEDVFRKLGGQRGVLFLDLGKAWLIFFRQLGTAEAEIAYCVLDDLFACSGEACVIRAQLQRFVFGEQRQVLRQRGPEFCDLRLVLVIGCA